MLRLRREGPDPKTPKRVVFIIVYSPFKAATEIHSMAANGNGIIPVHSPFLGLLKHPEVSGRCNDGVWDNIPGAV